VLGGILGSYRQAPIRITGVMLAFAGGSLISAPAFGLFPEAVAFGGVRSGAGLIIGAAVFVLVNTALDRYSLRCRLFMVGTRFCASAARPNAENTALERQPLPLPLTALHCDPAKKSTLERDRYSAPQSGYDNESV